MYFLFMYSLVHWLNFSAMKSSAGKLSQVVNTSDFIQKVGMRSSVGFLCPFGIMPG